MNFDEILTMSRFNSKSSTELKILKIRQFDISRNTQRTTHVIDLIQRVDCNLHMTKQLSMSQIRVYDVVVTCTVFEIFERLSLREFSRETHFRNSTQIYEIDDNQKDLYILQRKQRTRRSRNAKLNENSKRKRRNKIKTRNKTTRMTRISKTSKSS